MVCILLPKFVYFECKKQPVRVALIPGSVNQIFFAPFFAKRQ